MSDPNKRGLVARIKRMGPAAIITSAFIGPGTIITSTLAGASYGYSLLWVVLLATLALMVLLEMSSRISIASRHNVIDAAAKVFPENKAWNIFVKVIIAAGTLAICFAFEAGNMIGAAAGMTDILGIPKWVCALVLAAIAVITVFVKSYTTLARIMQFFVSVMGVIFIVCAVAVLPSFPKVLQGLFIPSMPEGSVINALALVGTTLIGINLVLHSITSHEKWAGEGDVKSSISDARFDIVFNIIIGGLITMCIIIVGATVLYGTQAQVGSPLAFTQSLEPVLGSWARYVGDIGLFAAGLSSVIAVPFTLRAILSKVFNWDAGITATPARVLALIVIAFGAAMAILGGSPTQIIVFAQATSGFILPFIALIVLVAANNRKLLGDFVNKAWQNIVGSLAVVLAFILGFWGLYNVVLKLIG